ncbi:MAG: hypothetical protein O2979_03500 [Proteobacteria bacterium]|nr:hypothetical protein [Pseudomonadota bacterium]
MKSIVYRTAGAILAASLLVLEFRAAPTLVPPGGDAFASTVGGGAMAMAAYVNADALAEFLLEGEDSDE